MICLPGDLRLSKCKAINLLPRQSSAAGNGRCLSAKRSCRTALMFGTTRSLSYSVEEVGVLECLLSDQESKALIKYLPST